MKSKLEKVTSFRAHKTLAEEIIAQAKEMKGPDPKNAPNKILSELFGHKQFHAMVDPVQKQNVINFFKILNKRKIQITMLRSLAFRGIPEEVRPLRRIVWMILIGYLPYETHKWEQHMKTQKKIYDDWERELIIKPQLRPDEVKQKTDIGNDYGEVSDHPLNANKTSLWSQYFQDQEIWVEIEKDIKRTRVDMGFFIDARDPSKRHLKDQLKR